MDAINSIAGTLLLLFFTRSFFVNRQLHPSQALCWCLKRPLLSNPLPGAPVIQSLERWPQ